MKNRKTVVVAFLLIAAMLLGVGYAALTDTLTITGTAQVDLGAAGNEFDTKVYFSNAAFVSSTGSGTTTPDSASHTTDDATYEIHSLAALNDEAVFKFEITSESNVDVKVAINPTKLSGVANPSNSNTDFFVVTYEYYQDEALTQPITGDVVIASNPTDPQSVWVKVTVKVIKAVTSATGATFGVELTATTVD